MLRTTTLAALLAVSLLPPVAAGVAGQEADPPLAIGLEPLVSGLERPVFLAEPDDGSGRLFVVEQPGLVRIVEAGMAAPEPFLDITDRVESGGSEQGLLSVAFHPDFAENGEFFVGYTAQAGEGSGDNTVSRFRVSADDPNRADPVSEEVLLAITDPYPNHNGGLVAFGPDGYLYAGLGDGGSGGDPEGNAQNPETLLGSILRIDIDDAAPGLPYAIPADNPYADGAGGRPEIWASGLRNPWRFAFDRETGDLWIADVGQNWIEEVNFQAANAPGGANYGWNVLEGTACFAAAACDPEPFVAPVAEYTHDFGCSVTGGYVARGAAEVEGLAGVYLFGDYCSGLVWGLAPTEADGWTTLGPVETGLNISSFAEDQAGNLYLLALDGTVYRITGGA
ncbi:MAG: PQQ-dependent sugar dehydrogenase [Chloroflexia bacterium]|nr:PQQ-dependent sugar dehydrogenase [Chloroflexia bacterium]